jgi:hypothetical protein
MFPKEWNGIPIPKAITAEWIATTPEPYLGLEAYLLSLICTAKWRKTGDTVLDALPPAYRWILRFCEFYSDLNNGGFIQYLGNMSDHDGREIVETVEVLRRFGLHNIATMLRKAIALMGAELPPAVLVTLSKTERDKAAKRRLSDDELERRIDPIDTEFGRMIGWEYTSKIDGYIKRHPEEFVHEKLSTKNKPSRRHKTNTES